jgi:superfamily II DNA/RNA helicase
MDTWAPAGLSDRILALLNKFDMKEPFAIQKQAIPAILAGRDIIGKPLIS